MIGHGARGRGRVGVAACALLAAVACQAAPPRVVYAPPPPVPRTAKGPPPRFHWGTRPPEKAELYVALEGSCPNLVVGPARHAMLLTYGLDAKGPGAGAGAAGGGASAPAVRATTIARFTDDGVEDMTGGLAAVTPIARIAGTYPTGLWLEEWGGGGGRARPSDRIWRWRTGADGRPGWEVALTPEPDHGFRIPVRWAGGFVAVEELSDPSSGVVNLTLRGIDLPAGVAVPDLLPPDYALADLVGFDTGELFAFGSRPSDGETIWSARWVTPSDHTVTVHSFGTAGAGAGHGELDAPSADDVRVKVGGQYYQFDAGTWAPVPPVGAPWAPPLPDPSARVAVGGGHAWAISKGELVRWVGGAGAGVWVKVDLPAPAFSSTAKFKVEDVAVSADGEAFVTASYTEKGPSWGDSLERRAVLRSRRPYQTVRCNDVDPESVGTTAGRGVQSWPPVADEACPTPFVVLARRSNAHPQAPDYAPLRLPLRGHPELEPLLVMDVPSGDHTYIGVPTKDLATAKKLLQAEARALSLHGEIVCADPLPARAMQIDTRTGGIVKEPALLVDVPSAPPLKRK
jgi:hypothetical protein